uniref:Uncharacterized protein n=1 Tax=Kalanchoe fedtschenkoi TaxID=63787 RepID=A0A7N0VJV7_KALFE
MDFGGGNSSNLGSGFVSQVGLRRASIYDDPDLDDDGLGAVVDCDDDDDELGVCSSSSSVGSRCGSSEEDYDGEVVEVESSYKGPLETMDTLQEVLPGTVRRGISKFYNGKSKSFTSLADAVSSSSVKELAKPETMYSKRSSNLLVSKISDKKHVNSLKSNRGALLKKLVPGKYGNRDTADEDESCSSSVSPPLCLPPLHPQSKKFQNAGSSVSPPRQKCSPWRSFSVSDLHSMGSNAQSFTDMVGVNEY